MVVVYTSNTGFSFKYEEMLAKKLNTNCISLKEALKKLDKNSEIIYVSWLMASKIKGYKKANKYFNIIATAAVGLCATGTATEETKKANGIIKDNLFTLQGGIKHNELKGIYKSMISFLIKMLKKQENKNPEAKAMLKVVSVDGDYVKEENLNAILKYLKK